jgi:hypothetical protein
MLSEAFAGPGRTGDELPAGDLDKPGFGNLQICIMDHDSLDNPEMAVFCLV